ncbi:hypothetical protein [Streptomyces sp. NPDC005799]|uniref:hypothetical protein n=1 Tax=Streptomyces sp. NPDC005799 TaxID=3154678 RepID=UPI0033EE3258
MAEWRPVLAVVAGTLLLAGCTGGAAGNASAGGTPKAGRITGAEAGPGPSSSASAPATDEPYTVAEGRAPRTRAEAIAFVRGITVRPDYFGIGFRKDEPYESDPAEWAVLGQDCVWHRRPLPATALASLTRRFVLPAHGGKGPVHVSLTVTVHRDTVSARRDMAVSLEEALRCPQQQLNDTERVRGLYSRADPFSEARNSIADDDLTESGEYFVDGEKGALPFDWYKYRLGPVTVAATDRLGAGRGKDENTEVSGNVGQGVGLTAAGIDRRYGNHAGATAGAGASAAAGVGTEGTR